MEREYLCVKGERLGDGEYRLRCLPEGKGFRNEQNWEAVEAGSLFVEGIGFAAPAFEFSQHGHRVVVSQDHGGGQTDISFREA